MLKIGFIILNFRFLLPVVFFISFSTSHAQLRIFNQSSNSGDEQYCDESLDDLIPADNLYQWWDTNVVHPNNSLTLEQAAEKRLRLVYNRTCDFVFPVDNPKITSEFGRRRRRMHKGIDIDLETGQPVFAAFEGKVRFAKFNNSYGNVIIIRHPNGLETYYAHLSEILVKPGDYVQPGTKIGLGGNTGRSRGDHLHFEMRYLGVALNPLHIIHPRTFEIMSESFEISARGDKVNLKPLEKYHTVKPGDTWQKICQDYCLSLRQLLALNNLDEAGALPVDAQIRIH